MVPVDKAEGRGLTYWDPTATLAFLAAHTSRIRLTTFVLVLGYHHPLEITKRYGTLDLLSGGRVVLGVALTDRRRAMADLWPTLIDGYDDVVDAEIVCGACGQPEHEGACSTVDLMADAAVEWPCGSCGHPNSDHDCVDGTCTVTDDAFDAAAGEPLGPCECRGLTRAG